MFSVKPQSNHQEHHLQLKKVSLLLIAQENAHHRKPWNISVKHTVYVCVLNHSVVSKSLGLGRGFPGGSAGKESACQCRSHEFDPGSRRFPEKEMAIPSSIFAWKIPMDRGAWWVTVHGVQRVGHERVVFRKDPGRLI